MAVASDEPHADHWHLTPETDNCTNTASQFLQASFSAGAAAHNLDEEHS